MNGIKTLAFAIHEAAEQLGGINPHRGRAVIEKATQCIWWLVDRTETSVTVTDLSGSQRQLQADQIELAECRQPMPPVRLSTGKLVETFSHPDGHKYTPATMTDEEWTEFCRLSQLWNAERDYDDRALLASSFNGPG